MGLIQEGPTLHKLDGEAGIIDVETGELVYSETDDLGYRLSRVGKLNGKARRRIARDQRYTVLRLAQDAMRGRSTLKGNRHRVCDCQRLPVPDAGAVAVVVSGEGNAAMRGLVTCASVWSCPVCSGKIALGRRDEVRTAIERHMATGGVAISVTYTLRHGASHKCRELVDGLGESLRRFRANRTVGDLRKRYGFLGQIRALEVTYGDRNGWHPHVHEVWLVSMHNGLFSPTDVKVIQKLLSGAWMRAVETQGLPVPDEAIGCVVKQITTPRDYEGKGIAAIAGVTGWDASDELVRGMMKKARLDRFGPFDLLVAGLGKLFAEYVEAFQGKRQLTWSPGLKDRYAIREVSDEELAEEEARAGVPVIGISREDFIRSVGLSFSFVPQLLDVVEARGVLFALEWLRKRGVAGWAIEPPS